jgi:hypothetical protein
MKKLFSLLVLAFLVGLLPLAAVAQDPGVVETIDNAIDGPAPAPAAPAPRPIPDALLYDNGPMVTHPGGGSGGADASVLQTNLSMNTFGFGHQLYYGYRIADDFEVDDPGGWDLDAIQFFAYQTNSPTSPSPITQVNYRIWNGPPNAGGTVICGDTSTNMLVNTNWTNIYRVTDYDMMGTSRAIFEDTVAVHAGCTHLGPGGYWIDWQSDGILSSGPWASPISIVGQTTTGNDLQSLDNGVTWAAALDTGTSTQQGLPFRIFGTGGMPAMFATHVRIIHLPGPGLLLGIVRMAAGDGSLPVMAATVDVEWFLPPWPNYPIPQSRQTNNNGLAFPIMVSNWDGTYDLVLKDATHPDYVYDPSLNWESSARITLP